MQERDGDGLGRGAPAISSATAAAAAAQSADKHKRSELLRAAHLRRIKAKAGDESRKVHELSFINSLTTAGKKADLQQRLEEGACDGGGQQRQHAALAGWRCVSRACVQLQLQCRRAGFKGFVLAGMPEWGSDAAWLCMWLDMHTVLQWTAAHAPTCTPRQLQLGCLHALSASSSLLASMHAGSPRSPSTDIMAPSSRQSCTTPNPLCLLCPGEARRAEALAAIMAKQQGAAANMREAAQRRRQAEAERLAQLADKQRRKEEAQVSLVCMGWPLHVPAAPAFKHESLSVASALQLGDPEAPAWGAALLLSSARVVSLAGLRGHSDAGVWARCGAHTCDPAKATSGLLNRCLALAVLWLALSLLCCVCCSSAARQAKLEEERRAAAAAREAARAAARVVAQQREAVQQQQASLLRERVTIRLQEAAQRRWVGQ